MATKKKESQSKTHYRKVFKSDHLGVADLEEYLEEKMKLVFTINEVKQELGVVVAGRKGDFNIAYFKEPIKPLVLNATNSKIVRKFIGGSPFVEDWNEILVELYIDESVKMKGEVVGGVRIRSVQPPKKKPVLNPKSPKWETAKQRIAEAPMTRAQLSKHYDISEEDYKLLCG